VKTGSRDLRPHCSYRKSETGFEKSDIDDYTEVSSKVSWDLGIMEKIGLEVGQNPLMLKKSHSCMKKVTHVGKTSLMLELQS